jgi:hypothetical protein
VYIAATRVFKNFLTAEPALADHLQPTLRYNAACAAAFARRGSREDVDKLDAK